ncbi:MAG: PD-(D/E)XK nuclease-like domain-containing protein [Planctomycetaceae bacterium]|jgi:hypothetical protein|nr:PD-(D/E)XK nuclease-like domain-containing protein [Planctomycetaceae bacterium]
MSETKLLDYNDTSIVSQSMLKVFIDSPENYRNRYVLRITPQDKQTDAMLLGSMVHCLFLEKENFSMDFHVIQLPDRRGNAWKAEVETAFEYGKVPVLEKDYKTALAMSDKLESNPYVQQIFEDHAELNWNGATVVEQELFWDGPHFKKKGRPDMILTRNLNGERFATILELKTTASPNLDEFKRAYYSNGYHIQAAWYEEGLKANAGEDVQVDHKVIAIRNKEPFDVAVYRIIPSPDRGEDIGMIDLGKRAIAKYETLLAESLKTDDWTLNSLQGGKEGDFILPERWML